MHSATAKQMQFQRPCRANATGNEGSYTETRGYYISCNRAPHPPQRQRQRKTEKERARERERERMTSIDSFFLLCLAFTGINPFPPGLWCHLPMRSTRVISLFTGESRARWFSGLHETLIAKDTMNEYRNAWLRNTSRHATYYASFISERKMPLRWK